MWTPVKNPVQVVSGAKLSSVGLAHDVVLHLHKEVELVLKHVRVVESSEMSLVLG